MIDNYLRTLILMRHAKSDWGDEELDDFDRPLAARGRRSAKRIGRWLRDSGYAPELVLCSAAKRTRATWSLVERQLSAAPAMRIDPLLYLATPQAIGERIAAAPAEVRTLLVVGHNPGLQNLALSWTPASAPERRRIAEKFPTAALAIYAAKCRNWSAWAKSDKRLLAHVEPRDLDD